MKLTTIKGFFPYMMLVFLNTFVDLGHKILIQDTLYQTVTGSTYTIFSSIINALILIPYILLFTPSGFIADKFPKATVLKVTAAAAIPLTILVTLCYFNGYFWGAFSLTLLLAIQSALNSPAKYGYIKEMFGKEHLSRANAIVQTLAIVAILGATFAFTFVFSYFMQHANLQQSTDKALLLKAFAPAGFLLVIFSIFETIMTFRLIKHDAADPTSSYVPQEYFKGRYLKVYLNKTFQHQIIFTCIIGLSVFWAVNQVLLATYGAFLKEYVGEVSVLFAQGSLAMGGIGILLGALYAGKVSKGFIETGLIPVAVLGITIGLFILPHLTNSLAIVLLFLGYGFFGGMLIVPLNALIQFNAPRQEAGKVQSANNFLQNCFMLSFLILTVVLSLLGVDSQILLYGLFFIALTGAIYTLITLPQSLVRYVLYFIASRFYRLSVYQLDNLPSSGGVLLLGNHVSFIDWAVLQIANPRPIRFVIERSFTQIWYLKWLFKKFKVIPIARGASQDALKEITKALNAGEVVALFPEGRLSINGQMGTFRTGFERSAAQANAVIIPFYIHGLWGSKTSYASQFSKKAIPNRSVCVVYGTAMDIHSTAQMVQQKVKQLSIKAWKYSIQDKSNIQTEWLLKAKKIMRSTALIEDTKKEISVAQLLGSVLFLKKRLKKHLKNQQNIGIILPASTGGVLANLSVLFSGKTIVNLNYTSSETVLESAQKQADIKTIISSRLFLKRLEARGIQIISSNTKVIFLEDLVSKQNKKFIIAYTLLTKILPPSLIKLFWIKQSNINSTAAILFSSGSEGTPKGVKLSHANIISNINQVVSVMSLESKDVMLNSLPLFHAFGLTITTLLPLLKGIPMLCCPDPTKVVEISKLIFKHKVTLMCSTSSLLGLFTRNAAIYRQMLASLRLVIAGAEKLSPTVYQEFKNKFNLELYEGYGATEVAPVASCNLPDAISPIDWHLHKAGKIGTVGLPLPGCSFRVVDPETLADLPIGEDGLILIGGIQVMQGYLNLPEKTQEVLIEDGDYHWYKTGDKGHLDNEGFLTIVDRYSRFAKIAGEMLSLSQVEQEWQLVNDEPIDLMAISLADAKKGEQLALIYSAEITESELRKRLLATTFPRCMLPVHIQKVTELPKLGNGKRDYLSAKNLFLQTQ
ncbi:MAG: acyl-[ACP]--phospholipid O-acyltransferase [Legionella sp.]|uniref:acyl-[ACP]--phospholipid O-acyltransferase n=1 Tax=Legionella sp. TaxID=459 RepID=UPI0028517319|nr:acyl-[ACP]--phospholipid O-acyltransferase [Legionella sp.]